MYRFCNKQKCPDDVIFVTYRIPRAFIPTNQKLVEFQPTDNFEFKFTFIFENLSTGGF